MQSARLALVTRASAMACLGAGTALSIVAMRRVVLRLGYDVDLNFWSEDYLLTSLTQLARGQPMYSSIERAASNVYSPGTAWLHYIFLAPFGLATSVVANRVLGQLVLLTACAVGALAGARLLRAAGAWPPRQTARAATGALLFSFLWLCACSNPVIDALHPTNLEYLALGAAVWGASALPESRGIRRLALLALLPALAFFAKQTAGVAVSLAYSLIALLAGSQRARLLAILPAAALFGCFFVVDIMSHGWFRVWGLTLLAQHPWDWAKLPDPTRGIAAWYFPATLVVIAYAGWAVVRRRSETRPLLCAATVALCYAPLSLAALLKERGGPNNLSSLGYALALVAGPILLSAARLHRDRWLGPASVAVLALQMLLWWPRRFVPAAEDFQRAARLCSYAARHLECGERVWLGRGASCYARAGADPIDRMTSIREVIAADRFGELGVTSRVASQSYDLILLHQADLTRLGPQFWPVLAQHYRLFAVSDEHVSGDFWLHGFQSWGSRRMLFFERKRDAGRHDPELSAARCPAPRVTP